MNSYVVFVCLVLAFVAHSEADPVRQGWASGATQDRDPLNPNYPEHGAVASASGKNSRVETLNEQKGGSQFSEAYASGHGHVSTFAKAK